MVYTLKCYALDQCGLAPQAKVNLTFHCCALTSHHSYLTTKVIIIIKPKPIIQYKYIYFYFTIFKLFQILMCQTIIYIPHSQCLLYTTNVSYPQAANISVQFVNIKQMQSGRHCMQVLPLLTVLILKVESTN